MNLLTKDATLHLCGVRPYTISGFSPTDILKSICDYTNAGYKQTALIWTDLLKINKKREAPIMNKRQQPYTKIFLENHLRTKKKLSPGIFLIGFNDEQLTAIEQQTVDSLIQMGRNVRIVDVENLSAKDIYCVINKAYSPTIVEAYEHLMDTFQNEDVVFIIKNLSKSKIPYKGHIVRKLVRALFGDASNEQAAKADLVFIDDARLLESNWDLLNTHVVSNYPGHVERSNLSELLDYAFLYCN